jgi:heme/copper-type cytochrome/quinol oxidase subunit 4
MNILYEPDPSVAYWLTLVVTLVLPILVGLVTKVSTNSSIKAVLLLALSAATVIISNLLAVDGVTDVGPMVTATIVTFVIAVATHFGLWKPTEVTATVQNSLVKD